MIEIIKREFRSARDTIVIVLLFDDMTEKYSVRIAPSMVTKTEVMKQYQSAIQVLRDANITYELNMDNLLSVSEVPEITETEDAEYAKLYGVKLTLEEARGFFPDININLNNYKLN